MIYFIYLLIILTLYKVNSTDYCDIQLRYCNNTKHVACVNNSMHLTTKVMKNEIKSMILGKFNDARNKIATNNGNNNNSLTIPHMMILNWKEELEKLAAFYIQSTYENNENNLCYLTLEGKKPLVAQYGISREYPPQEELHIFLQLIDKMIAVYAANEHQNSTFFDPSSNSVGCTFANIQRNQTFKIILQCLFDGAKEKIKDEIMTGLPCSKCDIWGVKCNEQYTGLCGTNKFELIENFDNLRPMALDYSAFWNKTKEGVEDLENSIRKHSMEWAVITGICFLLFFFIIRFIVFRVLAYYNTMCFCCLLDISIKEKKKKPEKIQLHKLTTSQKFSKKNKV